MKALVIDKYGPPEGVQIREAEKPVPRANEVLVRVHATTVNDYDWSLVTGKPYIYRLLFGLASPRHRIPGMELSGTVEAVGARVTSFQPGDAVYGDISQYGFGSFAQYLRIHEKALVRKPPFLRFEEAAALPHASMLALQGLLGAGKLTHGQQVLINGGGGGVGTFGVQIAKLFGAEVTGVDSGEKFPTMQTLGYDHLIDYKKTDFTRNGLRYDLIIDCKTNRSPFAYLRALKPGGRYVTVGGTPARLIQLLYWKPWLSLLGTKSLHLVALKPNKDLAYMEQLFEADKMRCAIDSFFPLEESARAIRHFGDGRHTGKVVVSVLGAPFS